MQILRELFLEILNRSITANVAILSVIIVRFFLKGFPKSYSYMLWAAVAFRLITPNSIPSDISVFNLPPHIFAAAQFPQQTAIPQPLHLEEGFLKGDAVQTIGQPRLRRPYNITSALYTQKSLNTKPDIFASIWLAGIFVLVLLSVISAIKIKRKINCGIRLYPNVYECANIPSPFIFGIFQPKIYIPFRLSQEEQQCILLHETCHIRRKDYLIKSFAFILAVLYWFHPLVWLSYYLMGCDMEMSCDEKVISQLDARRRKEYSRLLLAFASNKRQRTLNLLAFGEQNARRRIINVLTYEKPGKWKAFAGAAVLVLTMAACGTDSHESSYASAAALQTHVQKNLDTVGKSEEETHCAPPNISLPLAANQPTRQPAGWAPNSMFDFEFCTLDYADENSIIFHISSGLFAYSLKENRIIASLDLQALNCQEVQTGGTCRIDVYTAGKNRQKAVISPYPYRAKYRYIYDFYEDELVMYRHGALDGYEPFSNLISRDALNPDDLDIPCPTWKFSETIARLDDHTYGVLFFNTLELSTIKYTVNGQTWEPFKETQAPLPSLLKQNDSFYQSFAKHSTATSDQCMMEYAGFYRLHDYAGICALSTGLEYSDETQTKWLNHTDILSEAVELSRSDTECTYQFVQHDEAQEAADKLVTLTFVYLNDKGWRAEGLPIIVNP